jgi:MFS family permease
MLALVLNIFGVMSSYWIDLGLSFAPGSVAWRFPLAFQLFFCFFILIFIPFLPESPRWLVLNNRDEEAKEVLAALRDTTMDDRMVEMELAVIREMVAEMSNGSFKDLFTMDENRNLHRTILASVNQIFQQISGINLITYYAPTIYANLGMSDFLARLLAAVNGTEYFIASWPAVFLIEKVGRRKLMLFGAAGQAASMAILCGVNSNQGSAPMQACAVASLSFGIILGG